MDGSGFLVVLFSVIGVVYCQNSCITPNGETAQCISIYKCSVFIKALSTRTSSTVRFMRESRCGYMEDPLVCCGSVAHYTSPSSSTIPPDVLSKIKAFEHPNIGLLPSNRTCGIQATTDKVFGGTHTEFGEFPWMALLEYKDPSGKSVGHSCGGALISDRYVVTAAHCVVGRIQIEAGEVFKVRLGEHNVDKEEDCEVIEEDPICTDPVENIDVEEYIVHPEYDDASRHKYNDIALIRLKTPIKKFTEYIKPICLPLKNEATPIGRNISIAGWGFTEHGNYSSVLLKADIPIVTISDCSPMYKNIGIQVSDQQICAGGIKGIDSCSGDSGGPLMGKFGKNEGILEGKVYLEGIVSYGSRQCGQGGIPGVYTNVGLYAGWILDNIKP